MAITVSIVSSFNDKGVKSFKGASDLRGSPALEYGHRGSAHTVGVTGMPRH
jgi:hypothetical protein